MLHTIKFLQNNPVEQLKIQLGIHYNQHQKFPELYIFDYDQYNSPRSHPIVKECRGLILDSSKNWQIICKPFERFFDFQDPCAETLDPSKTKYFIKYDGSLMNLYFYKDQWHVSTRGRADASGSLTRNSSKTFAQKFWEIFYDQYQNIWYLNKTYTYTFELCCFDNQNVVKHAKNYLILLGARDENQNEISIDAFKNLIYLRAEAISFLSCQSAFSYIKNQDPKKIEGFVACQEEGSNFKRVKIVHPYYKNLFQHLSKNNNFSVEKVLKLIQSGQDFDFVDLHPYYEKEYNLVKNQYLDKIVEYEEIYKKYKHLELKDFAITVKDLPYSGVLFALKKKEAESVKDYFNSLPVKSLMKILKLTKLILN